MLDFELNLNGLKPLAEQIAETIEARIFTGELATGDRLPSPKELARQLQISISTVRDGYGILRAKHFISAIQGSAYYVEAAAGQDYLEQGKKQLYQQLCSMPELTPDVIFRLFQSMMLRGPKAQPLKVGWVDCTPEVQRSIVEQLSIFPSIRVRGFLLDHVEAAPDTVSGYHMLITTPRHHGELRKCINAKIHIGQLEFRVSQEIAFDVINTPKKHHFLILCMVDRFYNFVRNSLLTFEPGREFYKCYFDNPTPIENASPLDTTIILPGDYPDHVPPETVSAITEFVQQGGHTIYFCPEIDQGSILHLRERMEQIMAETEASQQ